MEEILKKQIEELEKLVKIQLDSIKNLSEVIIALKSQQTVQIQYVPSYQHQYYYPYYQYPSHYWGTYGYQGAQGGAINQQIGQSYAAQQGGQASDSLQSQGAIGQGCSNQLTNGYMQVIK